MNKEEFLANFTFLFDDTDESEITMTSVFKDIDEWSSLVALSVIAMCDEEYDVKVKGDDITKAVTVEDLFNIVEERK